MARDLAAHEMLNRCQALLAINAGALISLDTTVIHNPSRIEDDWRNIEIF